MKRSLFILCTLLFALGVNMVQAGGGQLERVDLTVSEARGFATMQIPPDAQFTEILESGIRTVILESKTPISFTIPTNISVDYYLDSSVNGSNQFGIFSFTAYAVTFRNWRQAPIPTPTPKASQNMNVFVPLASKPSGPTTFFIAEAMGFCPVLTCSPNQFKQLADGIVTFTWTEARGPCPAWEVKSKVIIDSFDGLTAGRFNGPVAITKVCVATIYW